jgi:integrase/recombinase XerD
VAGRCRPNTLQAVAFDLKAFFMVTGKDPVEVIAADVCDFLAGQRGDRSVVRLADRESGLSARTIARRLSSVSGLYAYLVARGDTPVQVNPVPRGLLTPGTKATKPMTGSSASMRMIARAATLDIGGKTVGSRLTRW